MRTYVVRIAEPSLDQGGTDSLRGIAEEIETGRQVRFVNGNQLLEVFASVPHQVDSRDDGVA